MRRIRPAVSSGLPRSSHVIRMQTQPVQLTDALLALLLPHEELLESLALAAVLRVLDAPVELEEHPVC